MDDFEECIYGAWLSELKNNYYTNGRQVLFSLNNMRKIWDLPKEIIEDLRQKTTERFDYSKTAKHFKHDLALWQ